MSNPVSNFIVAGSAGFTFKVYTGVNQTGAVGTLYVQGVGDASPRALSMTIDGTDNTVMNRTVTKNDFPTAGKCTVQYFMTVGGGDPTKVLEQVIDIAPALA